MQACSVKDAWQNAMGPYDGAVVPLSMPSVRHSV